MLDFGFSAEQESFRQTMRQFARRELAPHYAAWDQTGEYPSDLMRQVAELGLIGLRLPEEAGGMGADCVTAGIALEEIARGDHAVSLALLVLLLNGDLLHAHARPEQRREWLDPLLRGERTVALCLTEPGGGSDAAALKTRAVRDGDDYVLNGDKSGITLAAVADAYLVWAKTDPEAGARGVSTFLVPASAPGVSRSAYRALGGRLTGWGSVAFEDVRVPKDALLGAEGRGFPMVMNAFDYSRALIGLMCLGTAAESLEDTLAYVKQRQAFGQPLARFEGVQFPIAEHATKIEAARLLCYKTLWLRDQGLPHVKEAAMCKWWAPVVARDAIHEALLLHGHYGYTEDYPHGQRLRDVMGLEIGDGTAQVQKIVIARELLGRDYLPY